MRSKMIMKTVLMSLLMVAVSLNGFTKEKKSTVIDSSWMATPVQVDGLNQEWDQDTFGYYKKTESDFAFTNSGNNLYVLFIFRNPKFLSSLRHTGFTVWFNTEGKNAKVYGAKFIEKEITGEELIARMEKEQGPLQDLQKQKIMQQSSTYFVYTGEVIDKKGNILIEASLEGKREMPAFRSKPVKVGEAIHVVHEFKIPLNILGDLSADYVLEPGQAVSIGFEWGGFTKEVQDALAKQQAARGVAAREGSGTQVDSSGRAGISEERRDGSQRGFSSMASFRAMAKRYSFWVNMKLAEEK